MLEIDGALRSWIIPTGFTTEKDEQRLAIEDGTREIDFSSAPHIMEDGYGSGEAEVWDSGDYKLIRKSRTKILFEASGEKFCGSFVLLKPGWGNDTKKHLWLLIKY